MQWPPTNEPAYGPESGLHGIKEGNFFTLREEDHPAYVLFRALVEQGWEWARDYIKGGRHWMYMTHGKRFIAFSLFGQGHFGEGSVFDARGVCLEDYDYVWINALPHIITFMKSEADYREDMYRRAEEYKNREG
jgi:hypothetical protein